MSSFTRDIAGAFQGVVKSLSQVRFATKRALGSRTNMRDSAGRRLGPKKGHGAVVKPGEIIMRQRGTKIHPGANVGIGKDHTIFATEPGFVQFYLDPFHPKRKYVGVSLTKSANLPIDHWAPRLRRFGHEEIVDPVRAQEEEDNMCRKEFLAQDYLKEAEIKRQEYRANKVQEYTQVIGESSEKEVERLVQIHQILASSAGDILIRDAQEQVSYNHIFDLKTSLNRGEITQEQFNQSKQEYLEFAQQVDGKWLVDSVLGSVYKFLTEEQVANQQKEILAKLQSDYTNIIIKLPEKRAILNLITTPGIFGKEKQEALKREYLPAILPVTVKGTVVEVKNAKKPPKGVTVFRHYDEKTKKITVVGRTKEAFLPEEV